MGVFDPVFGAPLVGVALNVLFFGVSMGQFLRYYNTCERDPKWLKAFVAFLLVANTLNTIFDVAGIYITLVTHFDGAVQFTWYQSTNPAISALISCSAQLFYAYRISRLSGTMQKLTILMVLLAIASALAGIGTTIALGIINSFAALQQARAVVLTWLATGVANDLLIMGTLVQFLQKHKTGFASTDNMISRVILTTVETGVVTSVWATINIILYVVIKDTTNVAFNLVLCKLYTVSLLASLNGRVNWELAAQSSKRNEHGLGTITVHTHTEVEFSHHMLPPVKSRTRRVMSGVEPVYPPATPPFHVYSQGTNPLHSGQDQTESIAASESGDVKSNGLDAS